MIRFHDQNNFFELDLAMQEDGSSPACGDAYMTIKVSSNGFEGQNDLWVDASTLRIFCCDLLRLAADRQGLAKIDSMIPGELEVTVRSVNRLGHMIVEGTTGYEVQLEHGPRFHAVTFAIEFDPSQLNEVEKVRWVKNNVENHP